VAGTGPRRATPLHFYVAPVASSDRQPARAWPTTRGMAEMFPAQDVSEGTGKCPFQCVHVFAAGGSSMYQHQHCNHSKISRKRPLEIERIEEGLAVDRGSSFLQIPWQGEISTDGCRSCAIVRSVARQSPEETSFIVESANDGALVLRGPQLAGLVVVPRRCVSGLQELPVLGRGHVLAAVRLATLLVRGENVGSTSRIEVMRDPSAPASHVSYQVVPDTTDSPTTGNCQASQPSPECVGP
jgi:hypothetical protein